VNKKKANHSSSGASIDRYQPIGVFNSTASYRAATDLLAKQAFEATHPGDPMSFLYYHAIEFHLKAFLRLQKVSMSKLRGIGRDFIKLGVRSQHKGLVIDSKTNEILELLTESDAWGRARYLEVGMLAVPDIEELGRACQRLHKSVGEALATAGQPVRDPNQQESAKELYCARTIDRKAIWNRMPVWSAGASRLIERNRRPIHTKERRPAA
jgi:hypothetical protein